MTPPVLLQSFSNPAEFPTFLRYREFTFTVPALCFITDHACRCPIPTLEFPEDDNFLRPTGGTS
jgi:hypothetical protein